MEVLMAQATISTRIDAKDKERFDKFCNNVGLSTSAALYLFIKNVINEHKIPFEIRDPQAAYNAKEMAVLEKGIAELNAGKGVVHELIEEDD